MDLFGLPFNYNIFMLLPAVVISAIIAYAMIRYELLGKTSIDELIKYIVIGTVIACAGIAYFLPWLGVDVYTGLGYGFMAGIFVAGCVKIQHKKAMKRKKKAEEEKKKEGGRARQTPKRKSPF